MKYIWIILGFIAIISCSKSEPESLINEETPILTIDTSTTFIILKSGKFNGASGYQTNGTTRLVKDTLDRYSISFEPDFTTSFATGAVTIYLSKSMNLNLNDSTSFIRLAVINKNGSHRFALEAKPKEELSTVVVWCQPAGVKFGHADLK